VVSRGLTTADALAGFSAHKKRKKGADKAIWATARTLLNIIFVMLKKNLDYWLLEERLYNQNPRDLQTAA
jgi:hypothetical protein